MQNREKTRCNVLAFGLTYTEASPLEAFDSLAGQVAQQVTWLLPLKMGKDWAVITFPSAEALSCCYLSFADLKDKTKTLRKLQVRQADSTSPTSLEKRGEIS